MQNLKGLEDHKNGVVPKWKRRLDVELSFAVQYAKLSLKELEAIIIDHTITSENHDTVLALDFPHYCYSASVGCGGARGWCYTFQGHQSFSAHHRKVALIDAASKNAPHALARKCVSEIKTAVTAGRLSYPNIRFSGSGEVMPHHLVFLKLIAEYGVQLWGFSRNLKIANQLRTLGAAVHISCDQTTDPGLIKKARQQGFPLAYTSIGVHDKPPEGTNVTFPLHRSGRVREIVDSSSLCPKVINEYFNQQRAAGSCQKICTRCHKMESI